MTVAPPTYRSLLRLAGMRPLIASALLARTGAQAWQVGIVLFALQRYRSAGVAGAAVFLLIFPGLVLSPVTGALLDRHVRHRLMALDFAVAAACLFTITVLAELQLLPVAALLALLGAGSLTNTLSMAGARSLFPILAPPRLWDRANAADSFCYSAATVAGPALAGALTTVAGAAAALAAAGVLFAAAMVAVATVSEPPPQRSAAAPVLADSRAALGYVLGNRTLRWLAASSIVSSVGFGIVVVALPVVVFHLHGSAALVGTIFAVGGLLALPSTLYAGRLHSEGRERLILAGGDAAYGLLTLALLSPWLPLVAVAMTVAGVCDGPASVSMYSLRQRRTDPAWFGRAFSVSASLNYAGFPVGSALAGPLLAASLNAAVLTAALLPMAGGLLVVWLVPARAPARPAGALP
ncbi:MAG TPA: MFS transporter [Dehalococcoidia bacterium]|nr:MFS transporter [Dehalococcoidia bacterium]